LDFAGAVYRVKLASGGSEREVSRARAAMQEIANWLAMSPISDDRNNERADTMIVVHHLNNSRSQRILWLLEELNTPYRVETYRRDAKTNLAPSELRAVHPLGKSPVIQDGDLVLAESGVQGPIKSPDSE
jgi:hypothetical protein